MRVEHLLESAAKQCTPSAAQKARIAERVFSAGKAESWLQIVAKALVPNTYQRSTVQVAVHSALHNDSSLIAVRNQLQPSARIKAAIQQRIEEGIMQKANHWLQVNSYRWVAAFTAVALVVGISPRFVVAPQIFADADVRLAPISGVVHFMNNGTWQAVTTDIEVQAGMRVRTEEGEATISFRDDAIVRLAPFTTLTVNDIQAIGDSAPELLPTFTIQSGKFWAQGLVSTASRGVTFALPTGFVTVHEGSFSTQVSNDAAVVSVWDKSVQLKHLSEVQRITAGSRTVLNDTLATTIQIDQEEYASSWVTSNLANDASHREYIAKLQAERLRSVAGTLPTSTLYPVKRLAERVDVLLTFNEEDRLKKQINQANNRLTEAVALLSDGSDATDADNSLREYQQAIDVILESSDDTLSQILLSQSFKDIQANTAALKPNDSAYAIKETVLNADSALQGDMQNQTVVADTLDSVVTDLDSGNTDLLTKNWELIIKIIEDEQVASEDVRLEAETIARYVNASEQFTSTLSDEQRTTLTRIIPVEAVELDPVVAVVPAEPTLTIRQINALSQDIYTRIYMYKSHRGRENHLRTELQSIAGTVDEGTVLRSLYQKLPRGSNLTQQVRARIAQLGESQ